MKALYKYLTAIAVIVLGFAAWWTLKPSSISFDAECASNAYLVERFRFSKGVKDENTSQVQWGPRTDIVSIPDELPKWQKTIFAKAMLLPIDAGDEQVKAIFPSPPKVGELMGAKGFTLINRDDAEQHLSLEIQKYKGCLSQIRIFNFGLQTITVEVNFLIPTGIIASATYNANSCQQKLDTQQFIYSVNDVTVSSGKVAGGIPKPVGDAFSNWGRFNYNREYLFELVGKPMLSGSQYSWLLDDDELGDIFITEDVEQNCSKALTLRWQKSGNQHQLLKLSTYSEPVSS